MVKPVGYTMDAGWQLGVRTTVPATRQEVWDYLLGEGLPVWLGCTELGCEPGDVYRTEDGTRGELRSLRPGDRVRLTRRPAGADHEAILQIALADAKSGTTIVFHQDHLGDAAEREALLPHWRTVADRVAEALGGRARGASAAR
jgi:hypothetical protein